MSSCFLGVAAFCFIAKWNKFYTSLGLHRFHALTFPPSTLQGFVLLMTPHNSHLAVMWVCFILFILFFFKSELVKGGTLHGGGGRSNRTLNAGDLGRLSCRILPWEACRVAGLPPHSFLLTAKQMVVPLKIYIFFPFIPVGDVKCTLCKREARKSWMRRTVLFRLQSCLNTWDHFEFVFLFSQKILCHQ